MKRTYLNLTNKHKGKTIYILGCSPSLPEDLDHLHNEITIGINHIYKQFIPTYLFWLDKNFWESNKEYIVELPCQKIARDAADPCGIALNYRLEYTPKPRFTGHRYKVVGGQTSAPIAVQIAVNMGANKIIMLGCDCETTENKTNFYGVNKMHQSHTIPRCKRGLKWIKENCPVPVFVV